ncbi:hypothetical protein [Ferrovibrio sp.]|uniref:hypothetical protein n=1 Tax=Ferrovibrio sp. TaxID=1917215 RepID=UPI003516C50A
MTAARKLPQRQPRRPRLHAAALLLAALLPAAPLAGCADSPPPPPRAAAWIGAGPEAGGGSGNAGSDAERRPRVLMVRVLAVQPVRGLALLAPDGRSHAPVQLSAPEPLPVQREAARRPDIGISGSGGSGSGLDAGISIGLPLRNPFAADPPRWLSVQAVFRLPEAVLAAYLARPQDWLLDLAFDEGGRSLPAPPAEPALPRQ